MNMLVPFIRPTLTMLAFLTLVFGFIYPGISTLSIQFLFPETAQGSLIQGKDGEIIGSALIGQAFSAPKYFWGRLSATTPFAYNAMASTGSNFSAFNPMLLKTVQHRLQALRMSEPQNLSPIPVDLVTASGSGLDPEITSAAAEYQIKRVAKARGLSEDELRETVQRFTSPRQFGVLGEPRVNVLKLNLALDGKI